MNVKNGSKNIVYSDFYCQECCSKISLPRKKNKQRGLKHVKDIYCIKCKETTKHDEIRFKDAYSFIS